MGVFIWHQWAQYVSIFASVYTVWASIWGILFPKFFWDFVNGSNILQRDPEGPRPCTDIDPCGIVPAPGDAIFVNIIVKMPVVQILAMVFALSHLALELVPMLKRTGLYRSHILRVVTLTFQTLLTVLFYQGTNGAIYSFTAAIGFGIAQIKGEEWEEAKENRGRGEKA